MPLNLNDPKRQIIETETRSLINKIKNIAGDVWIVKRKLIFFIY